MVDQRGIALVSVLWTVTLLALIAASFVADMRAHGSAAHGAADLEAAQALADAGVTLGLLELLGARPTDGWRRDGTSFRVTFAGETLMVSIQDEAGKIDLNTADDQVLLRLFRSVGLGANQAPSLVDAVLEWRDEHSLRRLNGLEAQDYRAADHDYGPRNSAFDTVDKLRLVLSMTPALFTRLEPALTVNAMRRTIAPVVAPTAALRAIPKMTTMRVEQELARRAAVAASGPVVATPTESISGWAYTIRAQ